MQTRRVESFLLRIVVADGQALGPQQWRGRIQHVTTGAEQQIDELSQAIAFITNHLRDHSAGDGQYTITVSPSVSAE